MPDDPKLNELMNRWESGFEPDPSLRRKVLDEIEARHRRALAEMEAENDSFVAWARALARKPLLSGMAAAMFALVGMGLLQLGGAARGPSEDELTLSYRLTIDPMYRLQAMAGAGAGGVVADAAAEERFLRESLDWLQSELKLNPGQFEQVSAVHDAYESSIDELFFELLSSYSRYREFDRRRMSDDVIDYIALYELLQEQKRLKAASNELTAELIEKVSQIVTPDQRERFQRLMRQSYPSVTDTLGPRRDNANA